MQRSTISEESPNVVTTDSEQRIRYGFKFCSMHVLKSYVCQELIAKTVKRVLLLYTSIERLHSASSTIGEYFFQLLKVRS